MGLLVLLAAPFFPKNLPFNLMCEIWLGRRCQDSRAGIRLVGTHVRFYPKCEIFGGVPTPDGPSCGTLIHQPGVRQEDAVKTFLAYIAFCISMYAFSEVIDASFDSLMLLGIGYWILVLIAEKK